MRETRSANVLREKQWQERNVFPLRAWKKWSSRETHNLFTLWLEVYLKGIKRKTQKRGGKTLQAGLRFQFYIVFFPHFSSVCAPCFMLIALRTSAGTLHADSGYLMTLMFYWRAHGSEVEWCSVDKKKKKGYYRRGTYILAVMVHVGSLENGCKCKGDISRYGRDTKIHKIVLMVNKRTDGAHSVHIFQNDVVLHSIKLGFKGPLKIIWLFANWWPNPVFA